MGIRSSCPHPGRAVDLAWAGLVNRQGTLLGGRLSPICSMADCSLGDLALGTFAYMEFFERDGRALTGKLPIGFALPAELDVFPDVGG